MTKPGRDDRAGERREVRPGDECATTPPAITSRPARTRGWVSSSSFMPPVRVHARHDLGARAEPLHRAVAQHQHLVDAAQQRRPVRDDDDGHAVGLQDLERAHQRLLAFVVEVGVRLVEHHQARLAVQRARERDALALAGRERLPGFADLGVVALRQAQDELVHVRALRGADHLGGVGLAEARDVLGHRAAEELDVLRQVADVRSEPLARPGRDVGAVQAHHAGSRLPDADDQARERRLARRARTDQRERLAGLERERDAAQDRFFRTLKREDHALDLHRARGHRQLGARLGLRRVLQELVEPPPGSCAPRPGCASRRPASRPARARGRAGWSRRSSRRR